MGTEELNKKLSGKTFSKIGYERDYDINLRGVIVGISSVFYNDKKVEIELDEGKVVNYRFQIDKDTVEKLANLGTVQEKSSFGTFEYLFNIR